MNSPGKIDGNHQWIGMKRPYYFFGPCSAESPEQMMAIGGELSKYFSNVVFRAGLWKPRTRPNTFEGVGTAGLDWFREVKKAYGFKVITEVANASHVEACLKNDIDFLWLGARTTVNPFSVQEIADALKGVDIPVWVKNPINPDLALWLGALERINKAGIDKLGAIHRGFQLPDNGPYRNHPQWNIAVHLKAQQPHLPLICDVSHISGKRELLAHVAQKSIDLDMDGLMVETHNNPDKALSDPLQQVTPKNLNHIIAALTSKSKSSANPDFKNQLETLREKIDEVDDEMLENLAFRMDLSRQIGQYKQTNKVTVLQVGRWQKILDRALKNGDSLGLSDKFIRALFNIVHDESIRQQTPNRDRKKGE